jgi:hypothetical protein
MIWPERVCTPPLVQPFGETEIGDLRRAIGREQDIRGLEIAMDNAALVRRLCCPGQRSNQLGRWPRHHRLPRKLLVEAAAFNELHRETGGAIILHHVVDVHDIGMLQPSNGPRLGSKPGQRLGGCMEVPWECKGVRAKELLCGLVDLSESTVATKADPGDSWKATARLGDKSARTNPASRGRCKSRCRGR